MDIILITLLGFGATLLSVAVLKPLAGSLGLIDSPTDRKQHKGAIPAVGGIAIWLCFSICLLFYGLTFQTAVLIIGSGIIALVGAIDDARELSARSRLILQGSAALLACLVGGVAVSSLGELVFPGTVINLGFLTIPFTVFAIVGLINATNMSDGLDGLCGTNLLIPFAGLAALAGIAGDQAHLVPLLIICGCLLGFLVFNLRTPWRSRASVFLGDAGSGMLGFVLAWFLIDMSQGENAVLQPVAVLWFAMLLIFDSIEVIGRRVVRGRSPFTADREHLHHVFQLAKFSVPGTVVILGALTFIGVVIGMVSTLADIPDYSLFALFLLIGVLFIRWMVRTWSVMTFLRRSICRRRKDRRQADSADWPYPERRVSGVDRRQNLTMSALSA